MSKERAFYVFWATVALCLAGAMACAYVKGAPAPFPKAHHSQQPRALCGSWWKLWGGEPGAGGCAYLIELRPDGSYTATQDPSRRDHLVYTGSWRAARVQGGWELFITERQSHDPGYVLHLKLDLKLAGVTAPGTPFPNTRVRLAPR